MRRFRRTVGTLAVLAGAAMTASAFAQVPGQRPEFGPGMGPAMMGQPGAPGRGAGPGMMAGPGGAGIMHGQGSGPGRMGRMGVLRALGLNEDQRAKIAGIWEETRRKSWDTIGQVMSERFKLRELYRAEKMDPAAITEQQRKVDDLKRQILLARLEARVRIEELLTPEQRQKLRSGMRGPA